MQTTVTDDDDSDERQGDYMASQPDEQVGPSGLSGLEKRQGMAMTWYTLRKVSHWYP